MLPVNFTRQITLLLTITTPTVFIYSERLGVQLLTLILSISISREVHAPTTGYKFSMGLELNTVRLPRDFVVLPCLIQVAFEIKSTNYTIQKSFISNFKFDFKFLFISNFLKFRHHHMKQLLNFGPILVSLERVGSFTTRPT